MTQSGSAELRVQDYETWAARGPWRGCDTENGCSEVPAVCTCPTHYEDDPAACGEDEAVGCHFCAHRDIYWPCPNGLGADDE